MKSCVIKEGSAILKLTKLIFNQKYPGCVLGEPGLSICSKVHYSGLKRKFTMQCQEEMLMRPKTPASAAKQAFRSTDTFLHCMQGKGTQYCTC